MFCGLCTQARSPAITCFGSSLTAPTVSGSMPFSSAPVTVWPCEMITSLRMKGETPATPGTAATLGSTVFHSEKSFEYFKSMACELVPRILCFRSASKPLITESTTVSAQTPTATPAMEMAVITTVAGRLRLCKSARRRASHHCATRPRITRPSAPPKYGASFSESVRAGVPSARLSSPAHQSSAGGMRPAMSSTRAVPRLRRRCVRAMPGLVARSAGRACREAPRSTPAEAPQRPSSQAASPLRPAQSAISSVEAKKRSYGERRRLELAQHQERRRGMSAPAAAANSRPPKPRARKLTTKPVTRRPAPRRRRRRPARRRARAGCGC